MLAQLVCLDRRYQRMNCFNMRELQALLKEKYYSELITNYEMRTHFTNSLNVRHKLGSLAPIDNNMLLFITNNIKVNYFNKTQHLTSNYSRGTQIIQSLNYSTSKNLLNFKLNNFYLHTLYDIGADLVNFSTSLTYANFRFVTILPLTFFEDILKLISTLKKGIDAGYFLNPRDLYTTVLNS